MAMFVFRFAVPTLLGSTVDRPVVVGEVADREWRIRHHRHARQADALESEAAAIVRCSPQPAAGRFPNLTVLVALRRHCSAQGGAEHRWIGDASGNPVDVAPGAVSVDVRRARRRLAGAAGNATNAAITIRKAIASKSIRLSRRAVHVVDLIFGLSLPRGGPRNIFQVSAQGRPPCGRYLCLSDSPPALFRMERWSTRSNATTLRDTCPLEVVGLL